MSVRNLVLAGALTLTGCGRLDEVLAVISTDASTAPFDGAADAQAGPDASTAPFDGAADALGPADAATDDVADAALGQGPFGPVSLVAGILNGEDPSLSADELELFYASPQPSGIVAISVARRATTKSAWTGAQAITELGSPANEPCLSRDGMTLWFARPGSADAAPSSHIWVATRATTTGPWSAPRLVPELAATGYDDEKPSVDEASLVMVFMSNRPGGLGGFDVYMATRASPLDPFARPVNVSEVNTAGDERDPFIAAQNGQLFWALGPSNGESIRVATRRSLADVFTFNRVLTELGTPDLDPALSLDLHHIVFSSRRGTSRSQQLYEAFR